MKRGFSLIEVMVVMSIVVMVCAMTLSTLGRERKDSKVQAEAERLAATLRHTRSRAMAQRAAYGVAFHIQNGIGTSGAVLNNWDGGHGYRVIGPGVGSATNPNGLPLAGPEGGLANYTGGVSTNRNFPHFLHSVARSWVGDMVALPKREVRFLALGDLDEGPRRHGSTPGDAVQRWYTDPTYPRPWFGTFDQTTGRLYAWGGYDPSKDVSGFYYEGSDGDVVGSVNPRDRIYNQDWDFSGSYSDQDIDGDGAIAELGEREVGFAVWRQGEPRPLVNADWMDAVIMFLPDGSARFLEWNRGRRAYTDEQSRQNPSGRDGARNGIADRAKRRADGQDYADYTANDWLYTGPRHEDRYGHGEVGHFVRHTGGWTLTLAPDATTDDDRFQDVGKALDSITPAWRVHVGANGSVRTFRVQRRSGDVPVPAGRSVWPADPGDWNDTRSSSANVVWQRCRQGWLHAADGGDEPSRLVPVGDPIVDLVTERMLTDRIWWIDE